MNQQQCQISLDWISERKSFAVAKVIRISGSSSAKPGATALIDDLGKNRNGWMGGGCAEAFVCRQALEAIAEKAPRVVEVDLDDEVFGIGMPCGGKMEVYIEPILPRPEIVVSGSSSGLELLRFVFASTYEFIESDQRGIASHRTYLSSFGISEPEEAILLGAKALARHHGRSGLSLMVSKGLKAQGRSHERQISFQGLFVIGHSRITEELARLAAILHWNVRVRGLSLEPSSYPASADTQLVNHYHDLSVPKDDALIIASHHKGDEENAGKAMDRGVSYIGLIASAHRAKLIIGALTEKGRDTRTLYAPSGLDLGGSAPQDIALSIVAELICLKHGIDFSEFGRV